MSVGNLTAFAPHDDQATRLRALVNADETSQAVTQTPRVTPAPAPARHARIITIASGKGGVGKTNMAVNLSVLLAQSGRHVMLVDADMGTADADILCGLNPHARLEHVLEPLPSHDIGHRTIADIAIDAPGGFRLVPGSAGVARMADLPLAEQDRLIEGITAMEQDADYLLIDSGAGVGNLVTSLLHEADLGIIVATPEPTSIADAYALIKCFVARAPSHPIRPPALLINQVSDMMEARAVYQRINAVARRFLGIKVPLIGAVHHDAQVVRSVRARQPLVLMSPKSPAARNLRTVARLIHDRAAPVRRQPGQAAPRIGGLLRKLGMRSAL